MKSDGYITFYKCTFILLNRFNKFLILQDLKMFKELIMSFSFKLTIKSDVLIDFYKCSFVSLNHYQNVRFSSERGSLAHR